ncbi:hypothetical protein [Streptomyces pakalii]|uniref:Uncharacterized protein n=1 Tax=Streptomyces pakalii TaxID=3036494 RepID=A0ABT7D9U3_9ACTN|nr:hypothetical protein [Streptomyces pakalii]MDJ1642583.1 hypothetical protein [Streptomyces pakalii]
MKRADLERLDGLARNPAAPESMLLRILTGAEGPVRGSVFERDGVPGSVCDVAVSHPDREVRAYLAVGRGASGAQRARLAADPDPWVRSRVAELLLETLLASPFITRFDQLPQPQFPRAGLARFAESEDPGARLLVARDPEAPAELIERLSHDPSAGVRRVMAGDVRLPVGRLLELLDEPETTGAAAEGPALPLTAMEAILAAAGIP